MNVGLILNSLQSYGYLKFKVIWTMTRSPETYFLSILIIIAYLHISSWIIRCPHVKWVPCHHGMARPRVAGRGDGLQRWRVAANILNSSRGQPTGGGPPAWVLGGGLTAPHHKNLYLLLTIYKDLRNGRILWHDLSTRKLKWDLAHGMSGATIGQAHWKL
jgi:hypothetical protein